MPPIPFEEECRLFRRAERWRFICGAVIAVNGAGWALYGLYVLAQHRRAPRPEP
jgi:hypothetical protein